MALLKQAVGKFGKTVPMITHNESLTKDCDRVLHMVDGRLKEDEE
jgi:ABC-type lipoprotein export system ATPase subunit